MESVKTGSPGKEEYFPDEPFGFSVESLIQSTPRTSLS
jgi:hypothetical protein